MKRQILAVVISSFSDIFSILFFVTIFVSSLRPPVGIIYFQRSENSWENSEFQVKGKIARCNNSGLRKEAKISVLTRKNRGHCSRDSP